MYRVINVGKEGNMGDTEKWKGWDHVKLGNVEKWDTGKLGIWEI